MRLTSAAGGAVQMNDFINYTQLHLHHFITSRMLYFYFSMPNDGIPTSVFHSCLSHATLYPSIKCNRWKDNVCRLIGRPNHCCDQKSTKQHIVSTAGTWELPVETCWVTPLLGSTGPFCDMWSLIRTQV